MKSVDLLTDRIQTKGLVLSLVLWLMIWGGYNTDPERLSSPNLSSLLDLFHGLRALLPFVAAYLVGIILFARRSLPARLFQGPLGMLALYTFFGITSSILLSREPLTALYWAIQYGSVLVVLWVILADSNSLPCLSRLINLNWIIAAVMTIGMLAFLIVQPGGISALSAGGFSSGRPYEGLGVQAETEMIGMAGTRPTGLGRYAGVAALVAFAKLWEGTKRSRSIWSLLFLFFLFALIFSQGRSAILGFLVGAFVILWLHSRSKVLLVGGICIVLLLLHFAGFYEAFWSHLMLGKPFDPTLSGRTATWQEGWHLFLSSPLLGHGFYADWIFSVGHMHNAFLHALIQTGLIGTIPFALAFIWTWIILFRLLRRSFVLEVKNPLIEITGLLAFFIVRTITESTGAFYGSEWLFLSPLLAYITVLYRRKPILKK